MANSPAAAENVDSTHHLGETDPCKKPSVPLTHQGDFGIKHDGQCQPKHHGNEFSWDYENTPEDDHQSNQLEQDIHKEEELGEGEFLATSKGQLQTQAHESLNQGKIVV